MNTGWRRVASAVVALLLAVSMGAAYLLAVRTGPVVGAGVEVGPWRPAIGRPDPPPAGAYEGLDATDSRLYAVTLDPLTCAPPPDDGGEGLQAFADCVLAGQRAGFTAHGMTLPPVRVVSFVATGTATSACGQVTSYAQYCPADQTIHIAESSGPYTGTRLGRAFVLTHELGHHLQLAGGISADHAGRLSAAADGAAQDEVTRRAELQAACFGAAMLAGLWSGLDGSPRDVAELDLLIRRTGDDATGQNTHGSVAAMRRWTEAGLAYATPAYGRCQTWTVPSAEVR